ncbi:hypothetical protein CHARACLAT_027817, partial [Characodon lateralis]|nr:hypothetical protein [Characodon lateralis]
LNDNIQQGHTNLKPSETPVAPPRLTEKDPKAATRHSKLRENSRETEQPEAAADETDFKRGSQSDLMGMLRLSQKKKMPAFTSYLTDIFDQEEKTDDVPIRQASSNKPGILKGVMKELQFRSSSKVWGEESLGVSA